VQVGDAPVADEDAGALELDLLGGESLEQAPARSEEHRDDVELELVEDAGGERAASRRSPRRSSSGRRRSWGSQMRASCSDGIERRSVCPLHRLAKEFPIEAKGALVRPITAAPPSSSQPRIAAQPTVAWPGTTES
jgi:hypothetical protein